MRCIAAFFVRRGGKQKESNRRSPRLVPYPKPSRITNDQDARGTTKERRTPTRPLFFLPGYLEMQNRFPTKPGDLVLVIEAATPLSLFIDFALFFVIKIVLFPCPVRSCIMQLGVAGRILAHSMRRR